MGSPRDRDDDPLPAALDKPKVAGPLDQTVSNADAEALTAGGLDSLATEDGSMAHLLGKVASAPAAAPPLELAAGTVVDGTFRVARPLGQGGMGIVYLARDLDLQRDVALKVHRAQTGLDRLQREAVAMAQLAHPNVLTVHAVGQVNGRLYVAMEYVPGHTLRAWLDEAPRSWKDILALLRAAGEGLAAAHAAGFVHRDFKPENVLVGRDGRPRVGDFGLVRVAGDVVSQSGVFHSMDPSGSGALRMPVERLPASALAETIDATSRDRIGAPPSIAGLPATPSANLTATGAALGTPAYMAPEQFTDGQVDARADQFAFCVVLYEALVGKRPFVGATYAELRDRVTKGEPDPIPRGKAPAWLARAVRRGLSRDPAARFPDMRALLEALQPPRARFAVPIAAGALIAGSAAAWWWLARDPAPVAPPELRPVPATVCADAGGELDAIWTPGRREALRARFTAIDGTIGPEVAARAERGGAAWVDQYKQIAREACLAEKVERAWSARVAGAAAVCLERGREALTRSLDRAARVERDAMPDAAGDLRAPFPIDECVDERVLLSDYQTPEDPAVARRVDDLVDRVRDVQDLAENKGPEEARAALAALWPEIEREAYPALTARALVLDGEIARDERTFDVAVEKFEQAYTTATAAGLDALALAAARWLIWVHGVDREEVDAARPWILQALPEAERYGLRHQAASNVVYAAAVVAEIDADYDRAIELHRKRVAALEDGDELTHAIALAGLGTTLDASGRSVEALVAYRDGLAAIERAYGAEHPKTVWIRSNIIVAQVGLGDYAGAVATAEAGVALLDRMPGVSPIEATNLRFNHAFALQRAGRLDDAAEVYQVIRATFVDLSGEDSPDVADVDANLGDLLRKADRFDEARKHLRHALEVRKARFGEGHDEVANTYALLADVESDAGACARAVPYWRKSLAGYRAVQEKSGVIHPRSPGPHIGIGQCHERAGKLDAAIASFTEARRLAELGQDPQFKREAAWGLGWALAKARRVSEARAVLIEARARIQDDDPRAAPDRAEIDAWLAKH